MFFYRLSISISSVSRISFRFAGFNECILSTMWCQRAYSFSPHFCVQFSFEFSRLFSLNYICAVMVLLVILKHGLLGDSVCCCCCCYGFMFCVYSCFVILLRWVTCSLDVVSHLLDSPDFETYLRRRPLALYSHSTHISSVRISCCSGFCFRFVFFSSSPLYLSILPFLFVIFCLHLFLHWV